MSVKGEHFRRLLQAGRSFNVAVEMSGLDRNHARTQAQRWGYLPPAKPNRPRNAFRQAIATGYDQGLSAATIAAQNGSTAASVRVLANRYGISRSPREAAAARTATRRGFIIPPELEADYALFRRKKIPAREAAIALGIVKP